MISFEARRELGRAWARISGFRLAFLTPNQEARAIRVVANFVQDELGLFPYVETFCNDASAIEAAHDAGVEWTTSAWTQ